MQIAGRGQIFLEEHRYGTSIVLMSTEAKPPIRLVVHLGPMVYSKRAERADGILTIET